MKEFLNAFTALAEQVREACGSSLIWKDADPQRWLEIPPALSQHRHPYCLAVKKKAHRRLACCQADNKPPGAVMMEKRCCPFGVVEWVVPGRRNGVLLGWTFVGNWSAGSVEPPVRVALPPAEPPQRSKAQATLVARLLPGILVFHPGAPAEADERLVAAREFLEENLDIHLPASACAKHLGLSTSRFIHWFTEASGQSWKQELTRRVLARAADRLRAEKETVTRIGLDAGYGSPAGFTVAFARHYGLPPAAWRKKFAVAGE
ncbi:MAG: AraC family transcriptional regulator [Opitutales bacterium]|nr:AraC family transcriptional regulator [Opitutales bacterium]